MLVEELAHNTIMGVLFQLAGWYMLDVASAQEGSVELMASNEVIDKFKVKDIVGGNTIWEEKYISIAQVEKLFVYKSPN